MSTTSQAFEAAIQRVLAAVGTGDPERSRAWADTLKVLVDAADVYSVAAAKQSLADAIALEEDVATKQELGDILESLICCPPGALLPEAPPLPGEAADDEGDA